jgi:hypothetical protein
MNELKCRTVAVGTKISDEAHLKAFPAAPFLRLLYCASLPLLCFGVIHSHRRVKPVING